jgi:hypothetical protein
MNAVVGSRYLRLVVVEQKIAPTVAAVTEGLAD